MREIFEDILSTLCKFELSLYVLVAIVLLSVGYLCLQEKSPRTDPMPLSSSSGRTRTVESDCFICRGETRLGLETNCGHTFCGGCILEAWRQSSVFFTSFAVVCPYCWTCKHHCCYQRITTLLPHFRYMQFLIIIYHHLNPLILSYTKLPRTNKEWKNFLFQWGRNKFNRVGYGGGEKQYFERSSKL